MIRLLIAEDSAFQRKIITEMFSDHPEIEVIDAARNGEEAIKMVEAHHPDVLLLDLLMPVMDGLTALKYILENSPLPVIIFSVLDSKTLDASVQALILGAFDYIIKPGGIWKEEFPKFKEQLISKVILAYRSRKIQNKVRIKEKKEIIPPEIKFTIRKELSTPYANFIKTQEQDYSIPATFHVEKLDFNIIVIGCSVGGPKTLKLILQHIPSNFPCPILIVQHLDSFFMNQFATSLNQIGNIKVKIAENSELIQSGIAYLAPGDKHMEIILKNNKPFIRIFDAEKINFCKPSIDPLFFSAAHIFRNHVMGIILTGLGYDGCAGLEAIRSEGGETIAEARETSIVYGMPRVAAESGAARHIIPNYQIKDKMIAFAKKTIISEN